MLELVQIQTNRHTHESVNKCKSINDDDDKFAAGRLGLERYHYVYKYTSN